MTSLQSLPEQVDAIAIGASAGGVEALALLLPALPASLRVPVFIVLHLPRDRPSQLVEIFTPKCARPICEPLDKQPVEPGNVYFAPPDYHMLVDAGPRIALSADDLVCYSRPSIDVLFTSAADFYGNRLLGIILTGANEDGTQGIADIHGGGGITIVQRPEDAQSPFMLVSALKRTAAHFVLSLAEIADLLRGFDARGNSR